VPCIDNASDQGIASGCPLILGAMMGQVSESGEGGREDISERPLMIDEKWYEGMFKKTVNLSDCALAGSVYVRLEVIHARI
jgi:hypothetical protein